MHLAAAAARKRQKEQETKSRAKGRSKNRLGPNRRPIRAGGDWPSAPTPGPSV
jgi:hypothetical protein